MVGEIVMIPDDLPKDLPTFMARFGTDQLCRDYLFAARWPEGFGCVACGHGDAYALKTKIVYECAACGKQHSLLAGTIFEQTKTGLSRRFLAIHLVTSSKRGISAMELKRQMGFVSYGTAWTWLHEIRKAMVRPDRKPLAHHVEADETYLGGPRPGRRGRGAAGKTYPGDAGWQRDLSISWDRVGDIRERQGDRAGALEAWRRALAISLPLAKAHPDSIDIV